MVKTGEIFSRRYGNWHKNLSKSVIVVYPAELTGPMTEITFSRLSVVLLDRDGVINHEPGPILNPEQFG
ncbi:MAG: hypothetical protein Ct9H300mP28_18900 [Pseudomonadota bacterium]|nr:MAG: hypothetical protein Ct9H300mP28_18900 [Pseudomonadota bacterium]